MKYSITEFLSEFITPARLELFNKVLEERTGYITVVLEDIYQPQNASAVLRTCDCTGIQYVNVIENRNRFRVSKDVSLGSSKWLTIKRHKDGNNNSLDAINYLRQDGYRIIATTPHKNDQLLQNFDIEKGKFALVFGSELPGISETIINEADEFLKIPIYGFTESYNISVSAAITLFHLSQKMREQTSINWRLSDSEKEELKLQWLRNSIKQSNLLELRYHQESGKLKS
ncbi:MAG: RNA methyltransferase [Prolixibacteraceae bacterium]|nr:RNA methyltransferase [Prolixibacteraceae bacterium]